MTSSARASVLPHAAAPPSPAQIAARLVASAVAPGVVVLVVGVAATPYVLQLGPDETRSATRLFLFMIAIAWSLAALGAAIVVRRVGPLYRAVVRRPGPGEDAPPPSHAAVRDAFAAPRFLMSMTAAGAASVLVLEAVGVTHVTGLDPELRIACVLLAAAIGHAGFHPTLILWRRTLWLWLRHVRPSDIVAEARRTLAWRIVGSVASPIAMVLVASLAVMLAHLARVEERAADVLPGPSAPPGPATELLVVLAGGIALLGPLLGAAWLALRLGRVAADDLQFLTGQLRVLRAMEGDARAAATELRRPFRTRVATELADALRGLADRYAQLGEEETRVRGAFEQVQRLKSRFMAFMSHDLRSPLNSIKGFAQILAQRTDGPLTPGQLESVEAIRESGDALLRVVDDVLDSARLEAGRLTLHPQWTPVVEIVTKAIAEATPLLRGRDSKIVPELEPGIPPVWVDIGRAVHSVTSVLVHVVQATQKGTIKVRAGARNGPPGPERQVRIEVVYTSGDMRADDGERLFEAFRETRHPSGRRVAGLGLGLSVARGVTVFQGGDIWFEPGDRGRSSFCIALPIEKP